MEKTWKKLGRDVRVGLETGGVARDVRLEGVVDLAWRHEYERIFDWDIGITLFLALPDLVQTLAADTAAEVGVQLEPGDIRLAQQSQDDGG